MEKANKDISNDLSYNKNYNHYIENFYRKYYQFFYKISFSILKNSSDAEDAVSELFIKIFKYSEKISGLKESERLPYCVRIVKNISIDIQKRKNRTMFSELSENLIDSVKYEEGADFTLYRILERNDLYELLDTLSELEYEIIELRVVDKLKFKEIAIRIGISEELAKKKYQRTIKKLQKLNERKK